MPARLLDGLCNAFAVKISLLPRSDPMFRVRVFYVILAVIACLNVFDGITSFLKIIVCLIISLISSQSVKHPYVHCSAVTMEPLTFTQTNTYIHTHARRRTRTQRHMQWLYSGYFPLMWERRLFRIQAIIFSSYVPFVLPYSHWCEEQIVYDLRPNREKNEQR